MRIIWYIIFCLFSANTLIAQNKKWSLQNCIDYAFQHNIVLKQKSLQTKKLKSTLKQSKLDRLPNLNASTTYRSSYGRSLGLDNTYTNVDNQTTNFRINTSFEIFDGLQKRNTIKKTKLDLLAQLEEYEKVKEDIILQIASYYLEILFSIDRLTIAQEQIDITSQQIERTKTLIQAGKLPHSDIYNLNSQLAAEQSQFIEEKNTLDLRYLDLIQYIDLKTDTTFEIEIPEFYITETKEPKDETKEIYENTLPFRHELKALTYAVEASDVEYSISKGRRFPSVNFGADWTTNYFDNYPNSFSEQFDNNATTYWQVSLVLPIFNQWNINHNIELAKLNMEEAKLNLENQQNTLFKKIKTAYTNMNAALQKFQSSNLALQASKRAFDDATEKFRLGIINSFEFSQAKNQFNIAKINLSQAKYEYIFQQKILDFYKGIPIKL